MASVGGMMGTCSFPAEGLGLTPHSDSFRPHRQPAPTSRARLIDRRHFRVVNIAAHEFELLLVEIVSCQGNRQQSVGMTWTETN
jgi:hypothetical protein